MPSGWGGLALSTPTLLRREVDTGARAIAHHLKQSIVQDNSIKGEQESITRLRLHKASLAGGNQKGYAGALSAKGCESGVGERDAGEKTISWSIPSSDKVAGAWGSL